MTTKKKANVESDIMKGFDDWKKVLSDLEVGANKCYMPLVASSIKLTKELVEVYREAFKHAMDK